jgi:hypothetical protein
MSTFHHDQTMAPLGDFPQRTPQLLSFELVQHVGYWLEEKLCSYLDPGPVFPSSRAFERNRTQLTRQQTD